MHMKRAAASAMPYRHGWLARLGDGMARHGRAIRAVQWAVVAVYLFLVVTPAFLPLPDDAARIHDNLVRLAQFVFWGLWWPLVMVSMLLVGRLWCGIFCPEGALSEEASRFGRGASTPHWLRWAGWPFVAFVVTTVYGQLVTVYEYPKATLLVLGGSTVAAVIVGLFYGKGRRVWCRHLCPASGVFALLSRLAPLHFRVDRHAWKAADSRSAVICPPLVNIRDMTGGGGCHMCGKCSGHRQAVSLAWRGPGEGLEHLDEREISPWDVALLLIGLMGVASGAFLWSGSRLFVALKQAAAVWLVDHGGAALLDASAPWYVLTHYPEVNDAFTWLDGGMIMAFIAGTTAVVAVPAYAGLWAAARLSGGRRALGRLAMALIPQAAGGVILGLTALTLTMLKAEGWHIAWAVEARLTFLALAAMWSAHLAWRLLAGVPWTRRIAAELAILAGAGVHALVWARIVLG